VSLSIVVHLQIDDLSFRATQIGLKFRWSLIFAESILRVNTAMINRMVQMVEYTYNYHDSDQGSHKRQRIGPADLHLWPANEALTTGLTPHTAYDPVRDILHDDTIFTDSGCSDFANTSLNDSNLCYQEPTARIFHESYRSEDQDSLLTSQPFYEQTTAAFFTSFQDDFDESQRLFPQDATEVTVDGLAHSVDVGESPPQCPIVICFGMVCLNPLIVLLRNLTLLNTDCRHPRAL